MCWQRRLRREWADWDDVASEGGGLVFVCTGGGNSSAGWQETRAVGFSEIKYARVSSDGRRVGVVCGRLLVVGVLWLYVVVNMDWQEARRWGQCSSSQIPSRTVMLTTPMPSPFQAFPLVGKGGRRCKHTKQPPPARLA